MELDQSKQQLNLDQESVENSKLENQENIEEEQEFTKEQKKELEDKIAALEEQFLMAKAESQNIAKRSKEEVAAANKFAISSFARDLLSVKDALEMALMDQSGDFQNLKMGVEMTLKQFASVFERFNIKEIDPINEKLDPQLHQAISVVDDEAENNTIIKVMQKGYLINERVIRPASVIVSNGKSNPPVLDVEAK